MNIPKRVKIQAIIESMACEKGQVHYTDIVRALGVSPASAIAYLRAYCPGEYESGTCTADPGACPKKAEKKEEVEA
jgi:hypothetical protein